MACGNASGTKIPPYYVFPGKRWMEELIEGACPGSTGTLSETGWSNSVVFMDFMERHFKKHVTTNSHLVLVLFDGHNYISILHLQNGVKPTMWSS